MEGEIMDGNHEEDKHEDDHHHENNEPQYNQDLQLEGRIGDTVNIESEKLDNHDENDKSKFNHTDYKKELTDYKAPANDLMTKRLDAIRPEDVPTEPPKAKADDDNTFSKVKKYFMYITIGGFVVAALIAIVAVLIGEFNVVIYRSLFTVLVIVIHSLLTVAFMSIKHNKKSDGVILYTVLGVIVVSLLNSILGIWEIMKWETVLDVYQACFYAIIAAGIIRMLMNANQIDKVTRNLSKATIGVTVATYIILMPSIFVNYPDTVPEVYWRIMWATIILLVTMSVLVFIFNHLFLNQHPEFDVNKKLQKGKMPTWLKIVIFLICLPVILNIITWIISMTLYHPYYN